MRKLSQIPTAWRVRVHTLIQRLHERTLRRMFLRECKAGCLIQTQTHAHTLHQSGRWPQASSLSSPPPRNAIIKIPGHNAQSTELCTNTRARMRTHTANPSVRPPTCCKYRGPPGTPAVCPARRPADWSQCSPRTHACRSNCAKCCRAGDLFDYPHRCRPSQTT